MAKRKQKNYKRQRDNFKDEDRLTDTGAEGKYDRRGTRKSDKYQDQSWYSENEQMLRDAASLAYGWPLGSRIDLDIEGIPLYSAPGVIAYRLAPAVGISNDAYSAVNVASRNLYSEVRHKNSGHTNYDSPDLFLYVLGMTSCYSLYSWMVRLYGMAQIYSVTNRYYPSALIQANGVDFDDLMENLANFRYFINQYAVKLGAMCVPNYMSYIKRETWIYSNYYVDSAITAKAQTYMYVPDGFWQFDELSGAGQLVYKPLSGGMKVRQIMDYANSLIEPILASEDMNIMSGDILKWAGTEGILKVAQISEDYRLLPQYSEEVLSQIMNITVLPNPTIVPADNWNVTQATGINEGYLLFNPKWKWEQGPDTPQYQLDERATYMGRRILNMMKDDVTPGETMVATRLMNFLVPSDIEPTTLQLGSCGADVCVGATLWHFESTTDGGWVPKAIGSYAYAESFNFSATDGSGAKSLKVLGALESFDWHSPVWAISYNNQDVVVGQSLFLDVANYAILDQHTKAKMDDTACLSMFGVAHT